MRWLFALLLACSACKTDARKRHEVDVCRAIYTESAVSNCLMLRFDWDPRQANHEGLVALRDSMLKADSAKARDK